MLIRLDYLRGFAAIYVVLAHLIEATGFMSDYFIIEILKQGQIAVILFFILSGFVIHYNYHNKKISTWVYFVKRFRRIYPIFLLSLILSASIASFAGYIHKASLSQLFWNLLNMQDLYLMPGNIAKPYFNPPLWSLSYEWFFYLIYIPVIWLCKKYKSSLYNTSLIIGLFGIVFYSLMPNKIFLNMFYLIIWATGGDIAESYLKNKYYDFKIFLKHITFFGLFTSFFLIFYFLKKDSNELDLRFISRMSMHYFYSFIIVIIAFTWQKLRWRYFDSIFIFFGICAPFSYALYVFHHPIMIMLFKNHGNKKLDPMEIILSLAFVIIFSWIIEVKLQPKINIFFKRFY